MGLVRDDASSCSTCTWATTSVGLQVRRSWLKFWAWAQSLQRSSWPAFSVSCSQRQSGHRSSRNLRDLGRFCEVKTYMQRVVTEAKRKGIYAVSGLLPLSEMWLCGRLRGDCVSQKALVSSNRLRQPSPQILLWATGHKLPHTRQAPIITVHSSLL